MKINIKPLSVNKCWQGKRFKTPIYKLYEKELLLLLKPLKVNNDKLKISIDFGLSNSNNDIDNSLKPFLDILQKKYNFNDRMVYELNVKKIITNKGFEFINFKIENI